MVKTLRILQMPADVAGQAQGLSAAFNEMGLNSRTVKFNEHPFGYQSDFTLHLNHHRLPVAYLIRGLFFLRSVFVYDVFHFYFAESFLPLNLDLPLLWLLRKKVFFTFQGCDIRLHKSELIGSNGQIDTLIHTCQCNRTPDWRKNLKIRFINLFARKTFVLNPDLLLSSPTSQLLPYTHVNPREWTPAPSPTFRGRPLRIVHAPSDRALKGTDYIIQAVDKLKRDGHAIDFLLLEHYPHQKMRELCRESDIVIDQLIIGWYGGFSVEMMSLGKPVICYIDDRMRQLVPYYKELPFLNANSDSLINVLRKCLTHQIDLAAVGLESRRFVERIHDPRKIAQTMYQYYISC